MRTGGLVSVLISVLIAGFGCSGDDESSTGGAAAGDNQFANAPGGTGGAGTGSRFGPTASGACAEGSARTSRVKPRVVLLVDGSCSMSTGYPSGGGPSATQCRPGADTRWGALRSALLDPNDGVVSRLQGAIEFGMVVFGTQPSCPLASDPIQPALSNGAAIEAAFPQAPPGMYTPTGAALDWVYDNMFTPEMLDFDQGPQILLLATDGEPNSCGDANTNYQPSVDAAMKGQSLGVTTYVVSLASSTGEFHDHLQELANIGAGAPAQGGGAPLYEPTTPEQLAADLELLIGGAIGCDLALAGRVQMGAECQGTVTLNGQPLACGEDWVLPDPRHIRLQGSACDQLMAAANAALDARFPCDVFTPD